MSIEIEFSIWLASKTRWAHLTKSVSMLALPRVGEFVKFCNREQGDYFAWRISQITHRESGAIEVWTELLNDVDQRGYSFDTEEEFDAYYQSYLAEGWRCERGIRPNKRYHGG